MVKPWWSSAVAVRESFRQDNSPRYAGRSIIVTMDRGDLCYCMVGNLRECYISWKLKEALISELIFMTATRMSKKHSAHLAYKLITIMFTYMAVHMIVYAPPWISHMLSDTNLAFSSGHFSKDARRNRTGQRAFGCYQLSCWGAFDHTCV